MNEPRNVLSDEGRQFLQQQARQLASTLAPAALETNTAHSRYVGRVKEVQDGGLVFEEELTGNQVRIPWECVSYITGIAQTRSAAASAGG